MYQYFRFCPGNIGGEAIESGVNPVVPVMDSAWRIVRYENVCPWEGGQIPLYLCLIVEIMPSRLVFPCPVEPSKCDAQAPFTETMEVNDRLGKWIDRIMVPLDREDCVAFERFRRFHDDMIENIAT